MAAHPRQIRPWDRDRLSAVHQRPLSGGRCRPPVEAIELPPRRANGLPLRVECLLGVGGEQDAVHVALAAVEPGDDAVLGEGSRLRVQAGTGTEPRLVRNEVVGDPAGRCRCRALGDQAQVAVVAGAAACAGPEGASRRRGDAHGPLPARRRRAARSSSPPWAATIASHSDPVRPYF
jgi:hypothetical protein